MFSVLGRACDSADATGDDARAFPCRAEVLAVEPYRFDEDGGVCNGHRSASCCKGAQPLERDTLRSGPDIEMGVSSGS